MRDFVGYGAANDFEGAAAPGLTNTTADLRGDGPDTDNNAADFAAGDPDPRNTAGGRHTAGHPARAGLRIHDIQGAAHVSRRPASEVTEVPGVVTSVPPTASGSRTRPRTPTRRPARACSSSPAPRRPSRSATRSR